MQKINYGPELIDQIEELEKTNQASIIGLTWSNEDDFYLTFSYNKATFDLSDWIHADLYDLFEKAYCFKMHGRVCEIVFFKPINLTWVIQVINSFNETCDCAYELMLNKVDFEETKIELVFI